jgi:hypothetical protein
MFVQKISRNAPVKASGPSRNAQIEEKRVKLWLSGYTLGFCSGLL